MGGAFNRDVGDPLQPTTIEPMELPEGLIDENGDTNRLVVLLDLDDAAVATAAIGSPELYISRAAVEAAVVDEINTRGIEAMEFFGEPDQAWHLIRQDRLDEDSRAEMEDEDPREILQRYIVLSYPTVAAARSALVALRDTQGVQLVEIDLPLQLLWSPNDDYFPINPGSAGYYQWGMHAMHFPQAWDRTLGHGQVGIIDAGLPSAISADLDQNFRPQFSFIQSAALSLYNFHGAHVTGIVAATANNGGGIAGGCPTCSATMAEVFIYEGISDSLFNSDVSAALNGLIERGMQVVNMSFGASDETCPTPYSAIFSAISYADSRDTLLVAAAGNYWNTWPDFPAIESQVLSVGAAQNTNPANPNNSNWARWRYNTSVYGTARVGTDGIMAPGRSIVSTVPNSVEYNPAPAFLCSDLTPEDESNEDHDGFGSCTGTSMATPHVSALAGMLRSINPRLSRADVQNIIRTTGTAGGSPHPWTGHGLAQANDAVDAAIAQTTNSLTPLFSMYSNDRRDFRFTTVPQMASAATWGTLRPVNTANFASRYLVTGGTTITGYSTFPGGYPAPYGGNAPQAGAWVFTTPENPKDPYLPLVPLYRLSWKCGDSTPSPPALCSSVPNHMDTTYTADSAGVSAYESLGYQLDGIEGYIYPKTMSQPTGTVKLMRKYNPARDDHAIFPETQLTYFTALGYTQNSGSDWLGYVYPNSTGGIPAIL